MRGYSIEVSRSDLADHHQIPLDLAAAEDEIIARVDLAALTSNNITYAVHGGAPLHYWNFFPASAPDRGIVPVWGYGTVIHSRAAGVDEGLRLFGYWPSATHLKLRPGPVKAGGFSDIADHRQSLAPVYNSYRPTPHVPGQAEPLVALFQPLYGTGFVLAHSLAADVAAGRQILLTSASSKTALATAWNLKRAGHGTIGLTSAANRAFVERTGFYGRVLAYDELESLDAAAPAVLVDFSGNARLKARLHRHLKGLSASHIVGDTNWNETADEPLEGPQPALFFAPAHWEARARQIGPQAFDAELAQSMADFLATTPGWLHVESSSGPAGYADSFNRLLANKVRPDQGLIWRP